MEPVSCIASVAGAFLSLFSLAKTKNGIENINNINITINGNICVAFLAGAISGAALLYVVKK